MLRFLSHSCPVNNEAVGAPQGLRSPNPRGLWREVSVLGDIARLPRLRSAVRRMPRGSARVMVVPGFLTSDRTTWVVRHSLASLGHDVSGWGLGLNRGDVPTLVDRLREQVQTVAVGQPVHLIGWSLGGYLAREVAREAPDTVAQVITLGSPVVGGPKYTGVAGLYRRRGVDLDEVEREVALREQVALQVPVTALYSRRDAVVCPAACIDRHNPAVRHVEMTCSHTGFVVNRDVIGRLAALLADR